MPDDPNQLLRLIREALADLYNFPENADFVLPQLTHSVEALDSHLERGGALPTAWEARR